MWEYRPTWSTPQGGAGYTVLHFGGVAFGATDAGIVRTFFDAIKALLPSGVNVSFPGEALEKDPATGALLGASSFAGPATVMGTGTGAYPAPSGARVDWSTNGIANGRRVSGRTFIVPLYGGGYDTDGSLGSSVLTTLDTAAEAMIASLTTAVNPLVVWSRTAGQIYSVTAARVRDKASVQRGRNA